MSPAEREFRKTTAARAGAPPRPPWKHRLKESLRTAIAWGVHGSGLAAPIGRRTRAGRAGILVLHGVGSPRGTGWIPAFQKIHPHVFETTLRLLSREFRIVPVGDLVAALRRGPLREPLLGLSLDDGYRDNHSHAWPILQRLRMRPTIYLVGDIAARRRLTWELRLFLLIYRRGAPETAKALATRWPDPEGARRLEETSLAADPVYEMKRVLKYDLPFDTVRREVDVIFRRLGLDERPLVDGCFLDEEQIRAMAGEGVEFGAHTMTHPVLSRLSPQEQLREIRDGRAALEDHLSLSARTFAYPYGRTWDFDDASVRALREAGFDAAATSMPGLNTPATDPWHLLRIPLTNHTSFPRLRATLHGVYDWLGERTGLSLGGTP